MNEHNHYVLGRRTTLNIASMSSFNSSMVVRSSGEVTVERSGDEVTFEGSGVSPFEERFDSNLMELTGTRMNIESYLRGVGEWTSPASDDYSPADSSPKSTVLSSASDVLHGPGEAAFQPSGTAKNLDTLLSSISDSPSATKSFVNDVLNGLDLVAENLLVRFTNDATGHAVGRLLNRVDVYTHFSLHQANVKHEAVTAAVEGPRTHGKSTPSGHCGTAGQFIGTPDSSRSARSCGREGARRDGVDRDSSDQSKQLVENEEVCQRRDTRPVLACPVQKHHEVYGLQDPCNYDGGPNLSRVTIHLRCKKHSLQSSFVDLCATCWEHVVDPSEWRNVHVPKLCRHPVPPKQARGPRVVEQWKKLYIKLFPDADRIPSPYVHIRSWTWKTKTSSGDRLPVEDRVQQIAQTFDFNDPSNSNFLRRQDLCTEPNTSPVLHEPHSSSHAASEQEATPLQRSSFGPYTAGISVELPHGHVEIIEQTLHEHEQPPQAQYTPPFRDLDILGSATQYTNSSNDVFHQQTFFETGGPSTVYPQHAGPQASSIAHPPPMSDIEVYDDVVARILLDVLHRPPQISDHTRFNEVAELIPQAVSMTLTELNDLSDRFKARVDEVLTGLRTQILISSAQQSHPPQMSTVNLLPTLPPQMNPFPAEASPLPASVLQPHQNLGSFATPIQDQNMWNDNEFDIAEFFSFPNSPIAQSSFPSATVPAVES